LIIGWGRIGKVLAVLLKESGAQVTVGLRKEAAWKEAEAAGVQPVWMQEWKAREFDVVYNTVPASVLFSGECREDATLIDLASTEGIFGHGVIRARGLPGKDAPEESGALIAKTVLRYALSKEEEV
jgi:lactate dehydrogenase-like 2-hydroxyacid dehydrogenase